MAVSTTEFLAAVRRLFVVRDDVYADGKPREDNPEKYTYYKVEGNFDDARLLAHIKGEAFHGVYSISRDSKVTWFAMDFDAPKESSNPFQQAFVEALEQVDRLEKAGLHVYLERSRSGKGVHVWGFLSAPTPAASVRTALRPLLLNESTFDRMYPVQDGVTERKPYGNLIALPFHGPSVGQGNSVFLRRDGTPIPPREFVLGVLTNSPSVIEHLAAKAPKPKARKASPAKKSSRTPDPTSPVTVATNGDVLDYGEPVTGALKVVSLYGCTFMRHAYEKRVGLPEPLWSAALQVAAHFEHGRDFAHILSIGDPRYDEATVDARFERAVGEPRIGCAWIHENYPELACASCPMKAPHFVAKRSLIELTQHARQPMRRIGSFEPDLRRISKAQEKGSINGFHWGIDGLDSLTRLRRGELIVVGGAPNMGKTHFMCETILRAARPAGNRPGMHVFVFSAETGETSLRNRLIAHEAGVDSRKLSGESPVRLTPQEERALVQAAEVLETLPIYIDYTVTSVDAVLAQIEDAMLSDRVPFDTPALVVFDYLQYGAKMPGEETDYDRLSRLTIEFKSLAKLLHWPVMVLSQLKREAEGEEQPMLTWFRGTGRIEAELDVGLIMTGERTASEWAPRALWLVKQREGVANVSLDFSLQQATGRWKFVGRPLYAHEEVPEAAPLALGTGGHDIT